MIQDCPWESPRKHGKHSDHTTKLTGMCARIYSAAQCRVLPCGTPTLCFSQAKFFCWSTLLCNFNKSGNLFPSSITCIVRHRIIWNPVSKLHLVITLMLHYSDIQGFGLFAMAPGAGGGFVISVATTWNRQSNIHIHFMLRLGQLCRVEKGASWIFHFSFTTDNLICRAGKALSVTDKQLSVPVMYDHCESEPVGKIPGPWTRTIHCVIYTVCFLLWHVPLSKLSRLLNV